MCNFYIMSVICPSKSIMKENGKVLNKFTYSCCATDMEIHDESGALKYKIKSDTMQRKRFLFD